MSDLSAVVLLALLGLLLVRESRRVHASTVERRRWSIAMHVELMLWGACAALALPRLVELLT